MGGCETDENYNVARGAATQKKVFENCLLDGEIMIIIDGNKRTIYTREKYASGRSTKDGRSSGVK